MLRIAPSLIAKAIEQNYPWAANVLDRVPGATENALLPIHANFLGPLLGMIDQIPVELLALDATDSAEFVFAVAAVRSSVTRWGNRSDGGGHPLGVSAALNGRSPITVVLEKLRKCPDEAPAQSTAGLEFIEDEEMRSALRIDISAAQRANASGDYKAAAVVAGSVIEALLLVAISNAPADKLAAVKDALKPKHNRVSRPPEDWHLSEYAAVARKLSIIDQDVFVNVELAADYRNLIHPGRQIRLKKRATQATSLTALAAMYAVIESLTAATV